MLRTAILGFAICLAVASQSFGQDVPKPGPEHERLQELKGDWDAVMELGDQKTKATATYKTICGGMWLESNFQGEFGGLKFQGHGLDGYDLRKKKYVSVWVDSMTSAPLHLEGDYDAKKKLLTMYGESVGPDGNVQKSKNTTETKDKDHFTFRMYMIQPDGQENLVFTIEYARRK